ncbi:MAG: hypothetical protein M1820_006124 [Bogoriella megaspora]|nr:MAG: hypothetical protein M1820_006124 [Bogoriella megaspora]
MALVSTKVATKVPIPNQPWETAKTRFLDTLSENERRAFNSATPEDLFYSASATYKTHYGHSKFAAAIKTIQPLVECLSDFARALDVYANASSLVLCPLWGSIKVVLIVAQNFGKYFDKLVDMFSRIGDVLPRVKMYEMLFPNHDSMLAAIAEMYLDIIRFCTDAKAVFNQSSRPRINWNLAWQSQWKVFEKEFDKYIADFRRHTKNVDKEASISHMSEAKKAREAEANSRELQRLERERERHNRILNLMSSFSYRNAHRRLRDMHYAGTGEWLFEYPAYTAWLDSPLSSGFSIWGIPGAGKTILTSTILDNLLVRVEQDQASAVCYFYCDYADAETLLPCNIFACLARQLLENRRIDNSIEHDIERLFGGTGSTSTADLERFFLRAAESFSKSFIIIDGLDELGKSDQMVITGAIRGLLASPKTVAKVLVSCRREEHHIRRAFKEAQSIDLDVGNMSDDIKSYVEGELATKIDEGDLVLGDPALRSEIVDALVKGAKDMFLWARFQIDAICDAVGDEAKREVLRHLPRTLEETYMRILEKISKSSSGTAHLKLAHQIFKWIAAARRPLTIDELKEAVAIEVGDKSLQRGRIDTSDGTLLVQCCGNLVLFDRTDRSVRFAHSTVEQFLSESGYRSTSANPARFGVALTSKDQLDYEIAELCMTYLLFSDFEMQLTAQQPLRLDLHSSMLEPRTWNRFLKGGMIWRLLSAWSRWSTSPRSQNQLTQLEVDAQLAALIRKTTVDISDHLKDKYRLLEYTIQFWAHHCAAIDQKAPLWESLQHLVFERHLCFNFKPWLPGICVSDGSYYPEDLNLFRWAVDAGYKSYLRSLSAKKGVSNQDLAYLVMSRDVDALRFLQSTPYTNRLQILYDLEELHGEYPLRRACRSAKPIKMVRFLLSLLRLKPISTSNAPSGIHDPEVLRLASQYSCPDILDALVREYELGMNSFPRSTVNAFPHYFHQTLCAAIKNQDRNAVENLCQCIAKDNLAFREGGQMKVVNSCINADYDIVWALLHFYRAVPSFGVFQDLFRDAARNQKFDACRTVVSAVAKHARNPLEKEGLNTALNASLLEATQAGALETIEMLLRWGADINHTDGAGYSALHLALKHEHIHLIQRLLTYDGIDVNVRHVQSHAQVSALKGEDSSLLSSQTPLQAYLDQYSLKPSYATIIILNYKVPSLAAVQVFLEHPYIELFEPWTPLKHMRLLCGFGFPEEADEDPQATTSVISLVCATSRRMLDPTWGTIRDALLTYLKSEIFHGRVANIPKEFLEIWTTRKDIAENSDSEFLGLKRTV